MEKIYPFLFFIVYWGKRKKVAIINTAVEMLGGGNV